MVTQPLPAWPSYAFRHEPLNEGFKLDVPDTTLRSDFEMGVRQRAVFRNGITTATGQWAMTPAEYELFKAFQNIVGGGRFSAPIFVGADYRTCIVWFKKGTITASRQGGEWIVSAQIETQDKVIQSEAELVVNLLTFGSGEDAATLLDTFKHAVNYGFSAEGP